MAVKIFKRLPVAFISTYPPRECGIATFTRNLTNAIFKLYGNPLGEGKDVQIVALSDEREEYHYGKEVLFEIRSYNRGDYRKAADFLNLSDVDIVCIQHEFGIFGGDDGSFILSLAENLKKPIALVLHTVLSEPWENQRKTLIQLCSLSTKIIVLANKAVDMLKDVYGIPEEKIKVIPHGAPDVPFLDPSYYRDDFQMGGREVMMTFGLIGPGKGIEVAIKAMGEVVKEFPEAIYLIVGETHPVIKRERGEEYRISLKRLVNKLNLEKNIIFHNRFVTLEELIKYLVMADIYVTPYLSKEQISSGTLSYAVACGKATVSTDYWYAEELLSDERGIIVPIGDEKALTEAILKLLRDEQLRDQIRKRAYQYGRSMTWKEVASSYINLFENIQEEFRIRIKAGLIQRKAEDAVKVQELPEVNLDHLRRLSDSTGILQHATFFIPNKNHGYTTDDNARALIVALKYWTLFKEYSVLSLIDTYLSFLLFAYDSGNGKVKNFLSYDRKWQDDEISEDSHGRFLWALGKIITVNLDESITGCATQLFQQALGTAYSFKSPRAWAFTVLALIDYLKMFPGDVNARNLKSKLGEKLLNSFKDNWSDDWLWCENIVSYENGRLPQALIALGLDAASEEMKECGLKTLNWLLKLQTDSEKGHLSLIGNNGWLKREGKKANFDQQPVESAALIDACYEAYKATGEKDFLEKIKWCYNWFLGDNDINETLYNFKTGGCRDGIHSSRLNHNEGAESLLSWLSVLLLMYEISEK
ncbi:glycosyltransferase family 4 protein [candidate division WOR-3 bacterium]|nr:glycosyltransferase family 4 protein [candidate division WOR-3 bacterium]